MCSSKSITLAIFRSIVVEVIVYDNLERINTEGYKRVIHLASGNKNFTLRSLESLIDKINEKKKKVFWSFFGKI